MSVLHLHCHRHRLLLCRSCFHTHTTHFCVCVYLPRSCSATARDCIQTDTARLCFCVYASCSWLTTACECVQTNTDRLRIGIDQAHYCSVATFLVRFVLVKNQAWRYSLPSLVVAITVRYIIMGHSCLDFFSQDEKNKSCGL